jgi:hypothetical protein
MATRPSNFTGFDGNEATKLPQAFENISLDKILESDFCFKEQVLYRVHLEFYTANQIFSASAGKLGARG